MEMEEKKMCSMLIVGMFLRTSQLYDMSVNEKKSDVSSYGTGTESLTPILTPDLGTKLRN